MSPAVTLAAITYSDPVRSISVNANGVPDSVPPPDPGPIWAEVATAIDQGAAAAATQNSFFNSSRVTAITDLGMDADSSSDSVAADSFFDVYFEIDSGLPYQLSLNLMPELNDLVGNSEATGIATFTLQTDGGAEILKRTSEFNTLTAVDTGAVVESLSGVFAPGKYRVTLESSGTGSGFMSSNIYADFDLNFIPEPASVTVWCLLGLMLASGRRRQARA
jgi:hypothetical protein